MEQALEDQFFLPEAGFDLCLLVPTRLLPRSFVGRSRTSSNQVRIEDLAGGAVMEGFSYDSAAGLFDLDNTLIDRDGAFLAWARWWVQREGLDASAVDWLVEYDLGGFRPREELFARVVERFGLTAEVSALVDAYDREHPGFTSVERAVLAGLASLRTAGWRVAAAQTGATLLDGWMVGDHPAYDIEGGIAAGLNTIRIGNHHPTAATPARTPTHHFATILQAFPVILAS